MCQLSRVLCPGNMSLRDASKKCSCNLGIFQKGGGVPGRSKSFGALFCAPTILEFLVEMGGGGLTKSKSFSALFPQIVGEM